MKERTLVLIKPDGLKRGLAGEIIKRFEDRGLKICGMKMVWVDREFSKKHYSEHLEKYFYQNLENFIIEAPVVAMAIEGIHAVELIRKLVGPTEPKSAMPGTIRGDYAHQSYAYADKQGIAIKNLIHASGTKEEAKKELKLWFSEEELYDYKISHENEVL